MLLAYMGSLAFETSRHGNIYVYCQYYSLPTNNRQQHYLRIPCCLAITRQLGQNGSALASFQNDGACVTVSPNSARLIVLLAAFKLVREDFRRDSILIVKQHLILLSGKVAIHKVFRLFWGARVPNTCILCIH